METKRRHTRELLSKKNHPVIELFFEYSQLKNLYRQGWLKRGVSKLDCETVAEHSFGVALLSYIIAEEYRKDLDSTKVMKMGLLHEIGEIGAGDITPKDNISSEEKTKRELESVKKVFLGFQNFEKYIGIWEDFEYQKSPEAKFVKQIDRLEMGLQASLYERIGYQGLDEFFPYIQERINSPELKSILEKIIEDRFD